jgi:hypothetical protein
MEFASNLLHKFGVAGLILEAILLSILGVVCLITFIVLRRWYRARYFRQRSNRTYFWRSQWTELVAGTVPPHSWLKNPLDCQIIETMALDAIEAGEDSTALLSYVRKSGLLDAMVLKARAEHSWKKRTALIALGRTRAPEALLPLTEALDSKSEQTRIAAVRGLERTGLPKGAVALLERLSFAEFQVPEHVLKTALVSCCRQNPGILVEYLWRFKGSKRELIARVLAELATPDLKNELLVLSADPLPEVRASAARAFAAAHPDIAIHALTSLAKDGEWFVRLRAVVALGSSTAPHRIRPLIKALADPVPAVRKRAAWALFAIAPAFEDVLGETVEQDDERVLQDFVKQVESSSVIPELIRCLEHSGLSASYNTRLVELLSPYIENKKHSAAAARSTR